MTYLEFLCQQIGGKKPAALSVDARGDRDVARGRPGVRCAAFEKLDSPVWADAEPQRGDRVGRRLPGGGADWGAKCYAQCTQQGLAIDEASPSANANSKARCGPDRRTANAITRRSTAVLLKISADVDRYRRRAAAGVYAGRGARPRYPEKSGI